MMSGTGARVRRALWVAILAPLLLSGCGVKLYYDHLDWSVTRIANRYIDMDARQKEYFKAELAVVLYWHRTTELPVYAAMLRRFDGEISDGLTLEELSGMEADVLAAGRRLRGRFAPMAAEILYSTTPEQRVDMKRRFDKRNREELEPYEGLDLEGQQDLWRRDFEDAFDFFVGRLTDAQKVSIASASTVYLPEEPMWVAYRERWQASLFTLLKKSRSYPEVLLGIRDMMDHRERWYGEDYDTVMVKNEQLYRELTIELLNSLTEKQRRKLSGRLLDWAEAFDDLAADAAPEAPPPACMAGCAVLASRPGPATR